ncbi:MAG: DUF262 domain-containing protein [Hyphomicrobiaceae bacterium]|nr:DUF262 domain-containing protein [Hyphomicrobiaceae bacterium]
MVPRLLVGSLTLGELLGARTHLTVPAFQRPYSWGREEALQLLDDVSSACGLDSESDGPAEPDYFLGTLLLLANEDTALPGDAKSGTTTHPPAHYQIIDGQQRLVTLTIMIALLRDMSPAGATEAVTMDRMITSQTAMVSADADQPIAISPYRLRLSSGNQALFARGVQDPGGTTIDMGGGDDVSASASRIFEARDSLHNALAMRTAGERAAIARYLHANCHFVVTLANDIDRAHRLFTVLNVRGKPLRRNDVLKVELIGGIAAPDAVDATRMWDGVEASLGDDFEAFLGHLRAAHGRRETRIVAAIRQLARDSGGPARFVSEVLVPFAETYVGIRNAEPDRSLDTIGSYLHYLRRLVGTDWIPAALIALHLYRDQPEQALSLIRGIDRLAHVLRIARQSNSRRTTRFQHVVTAIRDGSATSGYHESLTPTRDELRLAAYNMRDPYKRNSQICKLLLLRINDALEGRLNRLPLDKLTVEHVLPVRPPKSSGWRQHFTDGEQRTAATDSIGNLTLLPSRMNDRLRNREFNEKRDILIDGLELSERLAIVDDVTAAETWSLETIAEREDRYLAQLRKLFGIDLADAAASAYLADSREAARREGAV